MSSLWQKFFGPKLRRRSLRVRPSSSQGLTFHHRDWGELPVANLSLSGLALDMKDQQGLLLPLGARFQGTIHLQGKIFPLELKIKHQTEDLLGTQFMRYEPQFMQSLEDVLKTEFHAGALQKVQDAEGHRWSSPEGHFSVLKRGPNTLLDLYGDVLLFREDRLSYFPRPSDGALELLFADPAPADSLLEASIVLESALRFLDHAHPLPQDLRDELKRRIDHELHRTP